jgi:DNA polymerase-3 subunit gamma/tau
MSYLVLARKWRPQTFEEIVGQEHISRTLTNAIRSGRVAHAFLFTGVRGVGKTTAARVLAKALNCSDGPTPTPCNNCNNCQEITAGNAVDVLEIDGASNTGVDDVREIIDNVRYQPAKSRFKIYIIDEVHMLSTSAFNALLKTLEEPPAHVKFIFATTDPHKVPHTIHSRCQRYDFKRIPYRLIAERLAHITQSDGVEISDNALFLLAREGEGSMRDAQSLLDQVIAFAGKKVSDADVSAALGLADRKLMYAVAAAIVDRDPATALQRIDEMHAYGYDLRRFTRELLEHFRDLAVARLVPDGELLSDLPDEERQEVQRQGQKMGSEDLDRCFRILLATEAEVARVAYPKLVLDMTLIKLATLAPVLPADELLHKLDQLQNDLAGSAGSAPRRGSGRTDSGSGPAPATDHTAPRRRKAAPQQSQATSTAAGGNADNWPAFLDFVGREKVTLLPYLQAGAPRLDQERLTLNVPRGYLYDHLAQQSHIQLLEDLAARFFGRPLRASIVPRDTSGSPEEEPPPSPAQLQKGAMQNPVVQAAVQILGGEVQEVKSRTRKERR